jgi:predicted MFS family arabinose efflux permease
MARRMTKAESKAWSMLIVLGLVVGPPIYGIMKLGDAIGWHSFAALLVAIVVGFVAYQVARAKAKRQEAEANQRELLRQVDSRRAALMGKYSDVGIVDRIMRGAYWQGQTTEQLRDSLG